MRLQRIERRWPFCVVAATGPSLSIDMAHACAGAPVIAVSDAWTLFPRAEILYSCDACWWDAHDGVPEFAGDKWSSHNAAEFDDKWPAAQRYGLNLIAGRRAAGFSRQPDTIHYGSNSGFQALNLALHAARRVILIGFDMGFTAKRHFFGEHPEGLQVCTDYGAFIPAFREAADRMPDDVEILNATPGSALDCFPKVPLDDALSAFA